MTPTQSDWAKASLPVKIATVLTITLGAGLLLLAAGWLGLTLFLAIVDML